MNQRTERDPQQNDSKDCAVWSYLTKLANWAELTGDQLDRRSADVSMCVTIKRLCTILIVIVITVLCTLFDHGKAFTYLMKDRALAFGRWTMNRD